MWAKILLIFFVFAFLFKTDHSFDQDLGRHLKLGEIIWQGKNIPKTNLFSYTNPDFPFINTHWLFEVTAYLGQQTIGLKGILILKIAILLLSVWIIISIPKNKYLLLPLGFIFLHTLKTRTELRPEIFSFLFTAVTFYVLEKNLGKPTKWVFLLPFIQLIWVNTHIYFFVGLILQAIFLLHITYQNLYVHPKDVNIKLAGLILLLSVAASLINPHGFKGFLYPFSVSQNYGYTIVENQTMFLLESINFRDPSFLPTKLSLAIIIFTVITVVFRRKLEIKNILLILFGTTLALLNVRSFPYLLFISLTAVLQTLNPLKNNPILKILNIFFAGFLLLESYFYLNGSYYKHTDNDNTVNLTFVESAKNAMDFVISNNLPTPIYNNFDIGSYIIYRGYPKYKVFVDGRPEAYPKSFFQDVYIPTQSDYQKFKGLEKQYGFKTIIFSHTDQTPWGKAFLQSAIKDPGWKIVYIDNLMIILALKESNLPSINLRKLNTTSYQFDSHLDYLRISLFLTQTNNLEAAQKFGQKAIEKNPQSPLGNALFGISTRNKIFW